jgi:hypothetical protein
LTWKGHYYPTALSTQQLNELWLADPPAHKVAAAGNAAHGAGPTAPAQTPVGPVTVPSKPSSTKKPAATLG